MEIIKIMNIKKYIFPVLTILMIIGTGIGIYVLFKIESKPVIKQEEKLIPEIPQLDKSSSIYLQSDNSSYSRGETFNINVIVSSSKRDIADGVEFVLTYDPEIIQIQEIIQGPFFSIYPLKQIDNEKGEVKVMALQGANENKPLNEEIIVTLSIAPLQSGQTDFDFIKDKTHIAGYGGQDLLENIVGLSLEIE